jgi:hypothetical protein
MNARILPGALATLAALAACSHPEPPAPVLSLAEASCAAQPDLAGAVALTLDAKDETKVSETIGANTPCFAPAPEARSLYRVFALPASAEPYIISVASAPVGIGVFAPHLTLLDASGAPKREIAHDSFVYRGDNLSVLFRSHPDERYLLVASDPGSVGQSVTRLQEAKNAMPLMAGPVFFTAYTGTDSSASHVYAHSGQITVTLSPVPRVK